MEKFFLPDHPELIDIFLTFLLPCNAAQIGKFMDHFMLTNMSTFINKLNIFFSKQPAQIRKIHACLKELTMEPDLKMEQIKAKVLPLLKGNPLLIEWFLQCFSTEQYPDSPVDEYEYLNLRKAIEILDDPDVYEELSPNQICSDPVDNPCHLKYLNGRIYYGNRTLLPGKLSFMDSDKANDQTGKTDLERESSSSQNSEQQQQQQQSRYRCMHSIRQYGNAKIKEHQRTHSDVEMNCSSISGEEHDPNDDVPKRQQTNAKDSLNKSFGSDVSDCCDDITLKAHAIRLNPTAHGSTINAEDTQNLLKLVVGTERLSDADREALNKSPKKMSTRSVSSAMTKLLRKSPKKSSSNKSPTNKKQQLAAMPSTSSAAIQTAKKLKKLIETPSTATNSSGNDHDNKKGTKAIKGKKKKDLSGGSGRVNKLSVTTRSEKMGAVEMAPDIEVSDKNEKLATKTADDIGDLNTSTVEQSQVVWSRDEDKLVLEQIKQGFSTENELIEVLESQLNGRAYQEIYDRFKFLMAVIAELRKVS